MKRGTALLGVFAVATAMALAACSNSSMPTAPTEFTTQASQLTPFEPIADPGVLSALQNPILAGTQAGGAIDLIFSAGASGTMNDPSMVAARSIQFVEFEVYDPAGRLLGSNSTNEVPTSGVVKDDGTGSLIVFAKATVLPSALLATGSYAIARVHGTGGETLVLQTALPASPQ